ncbi:MAG: phosphatase PAP2 family protein [Burkholderiaceae bacterium]
MTRDTLLDPAPRLAWAPLALAVLLILGGALLAGTPLDRELMIGINHAGAGLSVYASSMAVLGLGASGVLLAGFVGLRHPHVPAAIIVMVLIGGLVVQLAKNALGMPRPVAVLGPEVLHVIGDALRTRSMPSGHSALLAGVAALAWIGPWRIASWPLRMGLSLLALAGVPMRVVVAAHWPSDVLCGAGVGIAAAVFCGSSHYGVALIDRVERFARRPPGAVAMAAVLAAVSIGLALSNTGYPSADPVRAGVVAIGVIAVIGWLVRAVRFPTPAFGVAAPGAPPSAAGTASSSSIASFVPSRSDTSASSSADPATGRPPTRPRVVE